VRVERKIFRAQAFGGLGKNVVIQQNGAEDGALGVKARRHTAIEIQVSGGQGICANGTAKPVAEKPNSLQ